MKHIKLFESWQRFNKENTDDSDREYTCTLDKLLSWEIPDWQQDWEWLEDVVMLGDDWMTEEEAEYYLERFIQVKDEEISIDSQIIDGQVLNSWWMDGEYFTFITHDWPFTDNGNLTPEEETALHKLFAQLEGHAILQSANTADIIDYVLHAVRKEKIDPAKLTTIGFKNWFGLQRGGIN